MKLEDYYREYNHRFAGTLCYRSEAGEYLYLWWLSAWGKGGRDANGHRAHTISSESGMRAGTCITTMEQSKKC